MLAFRFIYFTALVAFLSSACASETDPLDHPGARLASSYCASCHLFPEPDLLDRESWKPVLTDMGGRLGVYTTVSRESLIARFYWGKVDPDSVYPREPQLTTEEWAGIMEYFLSEAPDVIEPPVRTHPVNMGLDDFVMRVPGLRFVPPLTSMVKIAGDQGMTFVGNYAQPVPGRAAARNRLVAFNQSGQMLGNWDMDGAPIAVRTHGDSLYILSIGTRMEPSEATDGSLLAAYGPGAPIHPIITGLRRPVDMAVGDLNGDGRNDIVVCEYGHHVGFLSWYEDTGEGSFRRHVLSDRPGAVDVELHDFDGDGLMDIAVLMAQGDEGVDIYFNGGGGRFTPERVLRFSPVHGSNNMDVSDLNGDGLADLIVVNGDNADITPVLKSFHGIRIYLAGQDGSFQERFFFPLHGAISAKAADFDQDGDLDIAAIAYFPDYKRAPQESFVLLRNAGELAFEPFSFEGSDRGRWITMDIGDADADGDTDIILGSNIAFSPQGDETGLWERWVREAPSFLILENSRRQ